MGVASFSYTHSIYENSNCNAFEYHHHWRCGNSTHDWEKNAARSHTHSVMRKWGRLKIKQIPMWNICVTFLRLSDAASQKKISCGFEMHFRLSGACREAIWLHIPMITNEYTDSEAFGTKFHSMILVNNDLAAVGRNARSQIGWK